MDLHIHRTESQPLTRFVDPWLATHRGRVRATFKCSDYKRAWCHRCHTKRLAKNLRIQVYYDAVYIWCADEAECNARKRLRRKKRPTEATS